MSVKYLTGYVYVRQKRPIGLSFRSLLMYFLSFIAHPRYISSHASSHDTTVVDLDQLSAPYVTLLPHRTLPICYKHIGLHLWHNNFPKVEDNLLFSSIYLY